MPPAWNLLELAHHLPALRAAALGLKGRQGRACAYDSLSKGIRKMLKKVGSTCSSCCQKKIDEGEGRVRNEDEHPPRPPARLSSLPGDLQGDLQGWPAAGS